MPTSPTSSAGRRGRGTTIGMALVVVMVLIVLAATVAAITTTSMHLAFTEEARQQALEVAYTGMAQFLGDVEAGMVDTTPVTAGRNLMDSYTPPPPSQDPFLAAITSGGGAGTLLPLPIPNNHLPVPPPGHAPPACYITFNNTQTQVPYSTSNLSNAAPDTSHAWPGDGSRQIPGFSVDVICTGVYEGVQKSVACKVTRRWTYAVCSAGPIFITGDTSFPSQIDGDVYSLAQGNIPDIGIGEDSSLAGAVGTNIRGEAVSVDASSNGVQVVNGNNVSGVRVGAQPLQYPNLVPINPAGFTPLASGSFVDGSQGPYIKYDPSHGWYTLEYDINPATGLPPTQSAPLYITNGNFYLPNTLTIRGGSMCSGIVLQRATLWVGGDLRLQARPTDLYGTECALCVTGKLSIHYGFMDGGDKGFVLNAGSIETQAGGQFKGLIIVGGSISMQSQQYFPPPGGFLEPNGLSEYAGGGGGGGGGPPPPPPQPPPPVQAPDSGAWSNGTSAPGGWSQSTTFDQVNPATGQPDPKLVDPTQLYDDSTVKPEGGRYPLQTIGAVLSPAISGNSPLPLTLSSVVVQYDPRFLQSLNQVAPLTVTDWEELP